MYEKMPTEVFTTDKVEIKEGDRIEIILPSTSIYADLLLVRGVVYFEHGSFKIKSETEHNDGTRLDDYSWNCIINKLEAAHGS